MMKTKNASPVRQLVPAALFLALAFVLPLLTGQVPKVGSMLCPMHFPVLLCGFVLGGPWGLAVGFAAPLLRSVLFGMPPMYPIAIAMAFELATYGAVAGFMYRKVQHTLPMIYATLVTSMGGRPPCLGCGALCAGRSVRLQLPVQRVPVRCGAHCRARHRGAAHPHSADRGRAAESKADGLKPLR